MTAPRRRWAGAFALAAGLGLLALATPATAAIAGYERFAVLEALDKVTGRVFTLEAAVDSEARFGRLRIVPRSCYKAPPEERPESAAFLEISEVKPGEPPALLFKGWMFASSPGLSTLEHPIYDVMVLDCRSPPPVEGDVPVAVEPLPPATRSSE